MPLRGGCRSSPLLREVALCRDRAHLRRLLPRVCGGKGHGWSSCVALSGYSTATITLEALITAQASLPTESPRDATEGLVMIDTISTPGAISSVTSQLTAPSTTRVTRPFRTLRALILIRIYQAKKRVPCNRFLAELAVKVTAARQFVNLPKGRPPRYAGTISRETRSRVDRQVSTELTDGRHKPIWCLDSLSDSHLALGSEGCILYSEVYQGGVGPTEFLLQLREARNGPSTAKLPRCHGALMVNRIKGIL